MRLILAAAIALSATVANAGFYTGNDLYRMCQNRDGTVFGYVAGWIDKQANDALVILDLTRTVPNNPNVLFSKFRIEGNICFPDGMILQQPRDIVCQFLEKHPERRQVEADFIVRSALGEAWPCSK